MELRHLARRQHGVVSRPQALASGLSARQVDRRVSTGRWQRILRGVYVVHDQPPSWLARASAALLYAGQGAALSHAAAAHLWQLDRAPGLIRVAVPPSRTVASPPGLRVSRRSRLVVAARRNLAVTSAAQTVVDLAAEPGADVDTVVGLLGRAAQERLCTPRALLEELARRRSHPRRALLREVIGDSAVGVESALERRTLRDVLQRHRIPGFVLQVSGGAGERRDAVNEEFGVVLEADGVRWHGADRFYDDRFRDRQVAAEGGVTLRVTWPDATARACWTARDVVRTLRSRGWTGTAVRCGPNCPVLVP